MGALRILVCSRGDPASTNLRDRLLELAAWRPAAPFRGHPGWTLGQDAGTRLVQVDGPSVTDEALDEDLRATGWTIGSVWFLSRHAAASGQPSLTVHPIGNPTEARFGGRPATLSPSAPRDMGQLLRALRSQATAATLVHQVTYEATHHGPAMTLPSLFVEIGSGPDHYSDIPTGTAAARAILQALREGDLAAQAPAAPVYVGVGGGHYMPRATDMGLAGEADFGHLLPNHALTGPDILRQAWEGTPGATAVHVHKKGMPGELRRQVLAWVAELGLPVA